ncbi:MAG: hypothetical protein ACPGTQ_15960 [Colwellia sp.]
MSYFVKILLLFSICFSLNAQGKQLHIDIFNKKIQLLEECVINVKRSTEDFTEYYCTGEDPMSSWATLSVIEYSYSDIMSLFSVFESEGSVSKTYNVNGYDVFELSFTGNKSKNLSTYICDAYLCVYIRGDYNNLVKTIKKQIL